MYSLTRIAAGCLCLSLAACSGGRESLPVVEARGQITLQGLPLDGATLVFAPQGDSIQVGTAVSGFDGSFTVTMNDQEGALPGRYKVIVTKFLMTEARLEPGEHVETPGESKLLTPDKYSRLESTDLEVTIPDEGSRELKVSLN